MIEIKTPARLHLGLLDTNGSMGRLFGSIGVAIKYPNIVLRAEPSDTLIVEGLEAERVSVFASRFLNRYPISCGAHLTLKFNIPNHVGLGSGTQLALAVGTALTRLGGLDLSIEEIALAVGRGVYSGIGINTFQHGGFVLDGGHLIDRTELSSKRRFYSAGLNPAFPPNRLVFCHCCTRSECRIQRREGAGRLP